MKPALLMLALAAPAAPGQGVVEQPRELSSSPRENELLRAVRKGDAAAVKALLAEGVSANAKFRYNRTALSFAADRGNVEVVRLLLARGADVNAKDTFYDAGPVAWAAYAGHTEVVALLLEKGADAGEALMAGADARSLAVVELALATGRLEAGQLSAALARAEKAGQAELAARLRKAGAVPPPKDESPRP